MPKTATAGSVGGVDVIVMSVAVVVAFGAGLELHMKFLRVVEVSGGVEGDRG